VRHLTREEERKEEEIRKYFEEKAPQTLQQRNCASTDIVFWHRPLTEGRRAFSLSVVDAAQRKKKKSANAAA